MSSQEGQLGGRRFFRAPTDVAVTVIVAGAELILSGQTLDVSRGGMRFSTATDLLAGQPVVLRFTLPGGSRELLIRARIVLSYYDAILSSFAHGVAFTQYAQADYDDVARYVDGVESAELPPRKP